MHSELFVIIITPTGVILRVVLRGRGGGWGGLRGEEVLGVVTGVGGGGGVSVGGGGGQADRE